MSTKNYKLFPARLQELRKANQYSQRQIAQALNISEAMYSRIESGERTIQDSQIDIVANLLKVEAKELRSLCLADKLEAETQKYSKDEIDMALKVINK